MSQRGKEARPIREGQGLEITTTRSFTKEDTIPTSVMSNKLTSLPHLSPQRVPA